MNVVYVHESEEENIILFYPFLKGIKMKKCYVVIALFFLFSFQLFASESNSINLPDNGKTFKKDSHFRPNKPLSLYPKLLDEKVELDGIIEASWNKGAQFSNFTEYQPSENRKPVVETNGYVKFDNKNLYVAFVCSDPDINLLRASITERDNIFEDDWVCVTIDPNQDFQKAYKFYANARGIQGDRLWSINGDEDDYSFDLVWDCDASISADHWTVEMKIPFESLRFPDQEKQKWSVHFTRNYPRDHEYQFSWMPITLNNNSYMGQAGNLEFEIPKGDFAQKRIEFLPYTVGTFQRTRNENPSDPRFSKWNSENPDAMAGFGVKYGLSSNVIADFTYNPDFSQIESDAGQISINSPFALFYQEKRPFFQEGNEIYTVDQFTRGIILDQFVNLFYSRSINDPVVAGKLSGKIGKMAIGYTTALDDHTPFIIPFEESSSVLLTEEQSINNIFRAKYDLGNQTSIGLFASDRRMNADGSNTVGAVDASIRLSDKIMLTTIAALTNTHEPNDPTLSLRIGEKNFKVGDDIKTGAFDGESFKGTLLSTKLSRASRHFTAAFAFQDFSPGFRADNGFIMTNGYRNYEATSGYTFRWEDHSLFTSIEPRVTVWRKYNYDGLVKDTGVLPTATFRFNKQITMFLRGFLFNQENLRGKQFGHARQIWTVIQMNTSKSLSAQFYAKIGKEINRMGFEGNDRNPFEIVPTLNGSFTATIKPTSRITNEIQTQLFMLHKTFWNDKIMSQHIWRNTFMYQFNKKLSLRLIAEYNTMDYYHSGVGALVNNKNFSVEPLVSYKLNAFSVFYFGAHLGGSNNLYLLTRNVRLNDQSVYMKLQYLLGR